MPETQFRLVEETRPAQGLFNGHKFSLSYILYFVLLLYLLILFYFVSRILWASKSYERFRKTQKDDIYIYIDPEGEKAQKLSKESGEKMLNSMIS